MYNKVSFLQEISVKLLWLIKITFILNCWSQIRRVNL